EDADNDERDPERRVDQDHETEAEAERGQRPDEGGRAARLAQCQGDERARREEDERREEQSQPEADARVRQEACEPEPRQRRERPWDAFHSSSVAGEPEDSTPAPPT